MICSTQNQWNFDKQAHASSKIFFFFFFFSTNSSVLPVGWQLCCNGDANSSLSCTAANKVKARVARTTPLKFTRLLNAAFSVPAVS